MGLDNGIVLRTKGELSKEDVPEWVDIDTKFRPYSPYSYDVCYWRKCWNIRSVIMGAITMKDNDYEKELTIDNLKSISKCLCEILEDPYGWDESYCIWEFKEMIPRIAQNIININWLINYLQSHSNAYCVFYDSY